MCNTVLDPTWAWDALRGWFLYGLLNQKSLEESLNIWQKMARHCIQAKGAQNYNIKS
jgi:sugar/nucleoside kinase (ribokinase family)